MAHLTNCEQSVVPVRAEVDLLPEQLSERVDGTALGLRSGAPLPHRADDEPPAVDQEPTDRGQPSR